MKAGYIAGPTASSLNWSELAREIHLVESRFHLWILGLLEGAVTPLPISRRMVEDTLQVGRTVAERLLAEALASGVLAAASTQAAARAAAQESQHEVSVESPATMLDSSDFMDAEPWAAAQAVAQPSTHEVSPLAPSRVLDNSLYINTYPLSPSGIWPPTGGPAALPEPKPLVNPRTEAAREVIAAWNAVATKAGLCKSRGAASALAKVQIRLKEPGWREAFNGLLRYAAGSDWLRGKNDRGWVADLEWALKPGQAQRYADRAPEVQTAGSRSGAQGAHQGAGRTQGGKDPVEAWKRLQEVKPSDADSPQAFSDWEEAERQARGRVVASLEQRLSAAQLGECRASLHHRLEMEGLLPGKLGWQRAWDRAWVTQLMQASGLAEVQASAPVARLQPLVQMGFEDLAVTMVQ